MHNILIDNNVPVLPKLDVVRERDFDTVARGEVYNNQFAKSREIRKGIAKYLSELPEYAMNEYPNTC